MLDKLLHQLLGLRDGHGAGHLPPAVLGAPRARRRLARWIMWLQVRRGEPYRHVVAVPAEGVRAVEPADAYLQVPRRVLGRDGVIRQWRPR